MTLVESHKTYCAVVTQSTVPTFLGIAMYTDFLRSVEISSVPLNFIVSLISNSPRAVSISDCISSGPTALLFF